MKLKKLLACFSAMALALTSIGVSALADDEYSTWSGTVYGSEWNFSGTTKDEAETYIAGLPSNVINYIDVDISNNKSATYDSITLKSADAFAFMTELGQYILALRVIDCADNGYWDPRNSEYYPPGPDKQWTIYVDTNIDLDNKSWTPVESGYNYIVDFQGHTVKNVKVDSSDLNVGLFSNLYYGQNLTIVGEDISTSAESEDPNTCAAGLAGSLSGWAKNITVKNAKINGYKYTGGIAGYAGETCFYNCHVYASTLTSKTKEAGGIVGLICGNNQIVDGCDSNDVTITAKEEVGGIAGRALPDDASGTIKFNNCYSTDYTLKATKNGDTEIEIQNIGEPTTNYVGYILGRAYQGTVPVESDDSTLVADLDDFNDASVSSAAVEIADEAVIDAGVISYDLVGKKVVLNDKSKLVMSNALLKKISDNTYNIVNSVSEAGDYIMQKTADNYDALKVVTSVDGLADSNGNKSFNVKIGDVTRPVKITDLPHTENLTVLLGLCITNIPDGLTVTVTEAE